MVEAYDVLCPILGNLICSGVCPPSKYAFPPPAREFCPFVPLPAVFPFLFPGPLPNRVELTFEPGNGLREERIEASLAFL